MNTRRCSAGWYELNISAPDNVVSACCYYHGKKEKWLDEFRDLRSYWNSPQMQTLRELNSGRDANSVGPGASTNTFAPRVSENGCSGCHFFENKITGTSYYDFSRMPFDLSPVQQQNWLAAKEDYEAGRTILTSLPLRIYANFGFTCNLTCGACLQVPHRQHNRRQVLAESVLQWREELQSLLDFSIIGGEPFALSEGLKFIRSFIDDESLSPVRLSIFTNGTVHHKYWDLLRRKDKLSLVISLDSIGAGYEKLRQKGKWNVVERNILDFLDSGRKDRPNWTVTTNAMMTKTGIPLISEFARWHVEHGIGTWFYDFISTPGNEDFHAVENVLHHPEQLYDLPDWERQIGHAVEIFELGKQPQAAASLDHYRRRLRDAHKEHKGRQQVYAEASAVNQWKPLLQLVDGVEVARFFTVSLSSVESEGPSIRVEDGAFMFPKTRLGDHLFTAFFGLRPTKESALVRARLLWRRRIPEVRRAHVCLQDMNFHARELFRQTTELEHGTETVIVASVGPRPISLRMVATPVGEDASMMPDEITLEYDGTAIAPDEFERFRGSIRAGARQLARKVFHLVVR
jgi:MoaA/NifB/PqqE/SkfB family radical SAM enzyme